ncbi:hypothetical protein DRO69_04605 [Candidatus Bathyarchaeota archaeon]|nr:MAG: hypothetical protein DRO69_04605 [Candidatus Bathyarchaeota archaeon]
MLNLNIRGKWGVEVMRKYICGVMLLIILVTAFLTVFPASSQAEETQLFTLHMVVWADDPIALDIATAVKSEFEKIGVNLEIHSMEYGALVELTYGETAPNYEDGGWDMDITTWWWWPTDYVWFIGCWTAGGVPPYGWNYMRWEDSVADTYLKNGMSTYNETERIYWLQKWQERFQENPPAALLYWPIVPQITKAGLKYFSPVLWTGNAWQWTVEGKSPEDNVTIRYAVPADPSMLNPWFMDGGWAHLEPMFSPLFRMKVITTPTGEEKYEIIPELVKSWNISEDGLTLTLQLMDNVTWHDGVPFTADDVVFSFEAILDEDTGATSGWDLAEVVDSVEKIDNYTVVLHLKTVAPHIFSLLSTGSLSILPKHVLGNVSHSELRTHWSNTERPVPGTGPYEFVEWKKDQYMVLKAYDNYHRGKPFVDKIILVTIKDPQAALSALRTGEVDALHPSFSQSLVGEIPALKEEEGISVTGGIAPAITFIGFNLNNTILNNRYVRLALCHAIPYDYIVNDILQGLGVKANSPVPPYWFAYNPNAPYHEYDLNKARMYLEKAGYVSRPAVTPITAYTMQIAAIGVATFIVGFIIGVLVLKIRRTEA